jgi:(p)ppGpp synthase/HD superfamily hydrolase
VIGVQSYYALFRIVIRALHSQDGVEARFDEFTKAGFARLLKHFENNTDDVVKLTKAFALATRAHKGKFLDEPHIDHSLRVALILAEEFQLRDIELVSAGFLHDALESVSENDVKEECGDNIVSIVRATADPKPGTAGPDEYYARLAKESKDAKLVKLAEQLDIARLMKNYAHREKALRFKDEAQKYAVPLAQNTDERFAFKLSVALYEIK